MDFILDVKILKSFEEKFYKSFIFRTQSSAFTFSMVYFRFTNKSYLFSVKIVFKRTTIIDVLLLRDDG